MSDSKSKRDQDDFEQRTQALLQASAEQLDGATRSRLTQARHAALDAIKQRPRVWSWLTPVGATAAVVLALIVTLKPHQPVEQVATVVDEMDIVSAEEGLEFYRDVDFYAWLDSALDEDTPRSADSARENEA